eukprot:1956-Heterococcus_DN1.PRE.6
MALSASKQNSDGGGTLSRTELQAGLAMLCEEDHSEVIAARMKQRAAQQHRQHIRETKRVALSSFLSSLDSVLPEVLQERQLFGKEVKTEEEFLVLVREAAAAWDIASHQQQQQQQQQSLQQTNDTTAVAAATNSSGGSASKRRRSSAGHLKLLQQCSSMFDDDELDGSDTASDVFITATPTAVQQSKTSATAAVTAADYSYSISTTRHAQTQQMCDAQLERLRERFFPKTSAALMALRRRGGVGKIFSCENTRDDLIRQAILLRQIGNDAGDRDLKRLKRKAATMAWWCVYRLITSGMEGGRGSQASALAGPV